MKITHRLAPPGPIKRRILTKVTISINSRLMEKALMAAGHRNTTLSAVIQTALHEYHTSTHPTR